MASTSFLVSPLLLAVVWSSGSFCPLDFNPVCCSDGVQYGNQCQADAAAQTFCLPNPSGDDADCADLDSLCVEAYGSAGYNSNGKFLHNGGCSEHFVQGAFISQDNSGSVTYTQCYAQCQALPNCVSFSHGRFGVAREKWCNLYSVQCTPGSTPDTDWNTFTTDFAGYEWQYNGGCSEHFDQGAFIYQDKTGDLSLEECEDKCRNHKIDFDVDVDVDCKSFTFGRQGVLRQNWCNLYSVECTAGDTPDTDWDTYYPINAREICDGYDL